tara:strand:- start:342 stop:1169 length:828 start_codon:yes stop_codon:yes gene_type:complete
MSEESVTSNEISPEIQHEAESQGWVPKERFRGNESDWVDADTFVKRGREILPILRKNNENLIKDLQATKDQLKEFREAAEEFKKFQRESYERKAQEYEGQIREIKESRAQAISDGDGQKVNALDDALDQAKENFKEAKQSVKDVVSAKNPEPTPEAIDPNLQAWLDRNTWFGQDKRLTAVVNGIGESLRLELPLLKGQAFLDKLDEVLAEEFPNKFGKKQSPSSRVESGSGRQSRSGGNAQSYDNLPPEAKSACDRFVKQKLMTREQYVADFDWT